MPISGVSMTYHVGALATRGHAPPGAGLRVPAGTDDHWLSIRADLDPPQDRDARVEARERDQPPLSPVPALHGGSIDTAHDAVADGPDVVRRDHRHRDEGSFGTRQHRLAGDPPATIPVRQVWLRRAAVGEPAYGPCISTGPGVDVHQDARCSRGSVRAVVVPGRADTPDGHGPLPGLADLVTDGPCEGVTSSADAQQRPGTAADGTQRRHDPLGPIPAHEHRVVGGAPGPVADRPHPTRRRAIHPEQRALIGRGCDGHLDPRTAVPLDGQRKAWILGLRGQPHRPRTRSLAHHRGQDGSREAGVRLAPADRAGLIRNGRGTRLSDARGVRYRTRRVGHGSRQQAGRKRQEQAKDGAHPGETRRHGRPR